MTTTKYRNGLALVAAAWVATVGCSDTEIQGVILDEDITTAQLLVPLARGSVNEMTDQVFTNFGGYYLHTGSIVDDVLHDGSSTFENQLATGDFSPRTHGNGIWSQGMEGTWSGLLVYDRAIAIEAAGTETGFIADQRPSAARGLLNHAIVERRMAETFCAGVYGFGLTGGFNLINLGPPEAFSNEVTITREEMFNRAVDGFQKAREIAEAAIAAGVANPAGSDPLFEVELIRDAAIGGLAQTYMGLASMGFNTAANWDLAVQHANLITTNEPLEFDIYNEQAFDNVINLNGWDNDDFTVWGQLLADGTVNGTPAGALFLGDPRADITRCGDFEGGDQAAIGSTVVDNDTCNRFSRDHIAEFGRQGRGSDLPKWNPNAYDDDDDDIPSIQGIEMRLIEAEAMLLDGDLPGFTDKINEIRTFYGADPIVQPATVGALEWPNAEDDGWSILDRERYLSLWLTGRRYFDMQRWNHPYIADNLAAHPRHRDRLAGATRFTCMPIGLDECNLNDALPCDVPATATSAF